MNKERLYQIILAPCVTEKATRVADAYKQIVFKVRDDANKYEIRQAVELMFDVKVAAVNVLNVKAKMKRAGNRSSIRRGWKKAFVALQPGHDIDFANVE